MSKEMEQCVCGHRGLLSDLIDIDFTTSKGNKAKAKKCPDCGHRRCFWCGSAISNKRMFCSRSHQVSWQHTELWKTKEYREKRTINHSKAMLKFYKDHPEARQEKSIFFLTAERSPYWNERISEGSVKRYQDPVKYKQFVDRINEPTTKKLHSENTKKRWQDPEERKKFLSGYGKCGWHKSSKAGTVYYRSSWEFEVYKQLDENPLIVKYLAEPLHIDYYCEGKWRLYIPDLLVEYVGGALELVEITPDYAIRRSFKKQVKIMNGIKYAQDHDMNFRVMTEREIWPEELI